MFINLKTAEGQIIVRKSDIVNVVYDTKAKTVTVGLGYNEINKAPVELEVKVLYTELVAALCQ